MHSATHPEQKESQPGLSPADEAERLVAVLSQRDKKDVMGHEALRVLRLLWPAAFRVSAPRPLKIGIDKDIAATNKVPADLVKLGLRCYTRLDQYLESTRNGRSRVNLEGRSDGKVRLDEAVNADMMLYARFCRKNPSRTYVGQFRRVRPEELS